jgi:hypothetical protein
MTNCCADLWRQRLLALATTCGCGAESVTTTFTLYRRTLNDPLAPPRDDIGLERRPILQDFAPILVDEPCVFAGVNPKQDRWNVAPEGQQQTELVTLYTGFQDIREGDNLVLAADGKSYLVEASTYVGPLRRCFLNSSKAQL